jgi:hypothetical protein
MTKKTGKQEGASWSPAAKVGAAVGSAALVAALLYAGRRNLTRKKGKLEPQSPAQARATTPKAVTAATVPKPKTPKKIPEKK